MELRQCLHLFRACDRTTEGQLDCWSGHCDFIVKYSKIFEAWFLLILDGGWGDDNYLQMLHLTFGRTNETLNVEIC